MSLISEVLNIILSFRAHSAAGYSQPEPDPTDPRPVFSITQDEAIAPCEWENTRAPPGFLFEGGNASR